MPWKPCREKHAAKLLAGGCGSKHGLREDTEDIAGDKFRALRRISLRSTSEVIRQGNNGLITHASLGQDEETVAFNVVQMCIRSSRWDHRGGES